ncbi:MAG: extracellular solute-binding protein [Chloroflexota bacterium]
MIHLIRLLIVLVMFLILHTTMAQEDAPLTFESSRDLRADFTLVNSEPVITREDGNRYLNGGALIFHDGEYHMFSNFFNSWPGETVSYYYTSPDGEVWERVQDDPIFTVNDVPLEGRGALALTGFVTDDGTWVLYYHTFTSAQSAGYIGRVTAPDPLGPWTFDAEPALSPGSEGSWDDAQVMRANVLQQDDGSYVMYYAGTTDRTSQIGMATSPDGITWTKYNDPETTDAPFAESDPILSPLDNWESDWLGRPEVVRTDDGWVMLYEGGTGRNQTGLAISSDGIHFARYEDNPILDRDNMVNGYTFFQGALIHHNDTYRYLIEAGVGSVGTDIYLFTFEGALTDEPVITAQAPEPFVFSSHYGGTPAGQWDVANAEAFFADYPNIDYVVNRTDYYRSPVNLLIHTELNGDNVPDVFSASLGGNLRAYIEAGLIADITDLWEENGWDDIFPASVKAMASVDGRQYFVPQAIQWNGIFYRTDVFESAGLEPPTTWDELLLTCDTLHEAGIQPFVMPANATWPPPMGFWFSHINMRLNGPDFHEQLMRGEIAYTDPRVREVFTYHDQLFAHNCFAENASSINYNQMVSTWNSGNAAMNAHGEWLYEFISENAKDNTGFIRFPIIDETVPLGELVPMYGAFMSANTAYPEIARAFLVQIAGVDSQTDNMNTIRRLPSNLLVDISALRPIYADGLTLIQEAEYLSPLIGSNTNPQVAQSLYGLLSNYWLNPSQIDTLLANIEATRQENYEGAP